MELTKRQNRVMALEKPQNFFDTLGRSLEEDIKVLQGLPAKQQKYVLAQVTNNMVQNIELLERIITTYDLPPEVHELFVILEDLVRKTVASETPLTAGGKRRKTRKHRGGGGPGTANAGTARMNATVAVAQDPRTMAALAEAVGARAKANTAQSQLTIARTNKTRRNATAGSWWSMFNVLTAACATALAIAGGMQASTSVAGNVAYFGTKVTDVAKSFVPFNLFDVEPGSLSVPNVVMKDLVGFNYEFEHPVVDQGDVATAEYKGFVDATIVGDILGEEASAFQVTYTDVLADPLVATGFPAIEFSNIKVSEEAQNAYNACRRNSWLPGACSKFLDVANSTKATASEAKTIGEALRTVKPAPESHTFREAVSTIADGVAKAAQKAGDTDTATTIDAVVNVFNGPDGLGLPKGAGRFNPEILIRSEGLTTAIDHCSSAIEGVLGSTANPLVGKVTNMVKSACRLEIVSYAKDAVINATAVATGEAYNEAAARVKDKNEKGITSMVGLFEDRKIKAPSPEIARMYEGIIQNVYAMSAMNIRFPPPGPLLDSIIQRIDEHYRAVTRAGQKPHLRNTNEIRWRMIQMDYERGYWPKVIGAVGGAAIAIAAGGLLKLVWLASLSGLYVAGTVGAFAKRKYDSQQNAAILEQALVDQKLLEIENIRRIDKQIADGEMPPEEGERRKRVLGVGSADSLKLIKLALTDLSATQAPSVGKVVSRLANAPPTAPQVVPQVVNVLQLRNSEPKKESLGGGGMKYGGKRRKSLRNRNARR